MKDDGYRGIWYMNQLTYDEYVYKYSGGLGTYCAKHRPFAVYCPQVDKTFFCYGGTSRDGHRRLIHMVSYYDHETGRVPRPTILLDKKTDDAHDNPVISLDREGYVWIFSTSHGTSRPSYIHRSKRPYDIDEFEPIQPTRLDDEGKEVPMTNFSYMQVWYEPEFGFLCLFTKYNCPAPRTNLFMCSEDGIRWSRWLRLAAIEEGHYQISAYRDGRIGVAFNYHPRGKGLNWRTNLYYMESLDFGRTWRTADGIELDLPLTQVDNPALVRDYRSEGLNLYLKDIDFDEEGRPVILYLTSRSWRPGPEGDPRTWWVTKWDGKVWRSIEVTNSDNNYDTGSIYIEGRTWRIIAPTLSGPQPYNPGGEMTMWIGEDGGERWRMVRQMTRGSERNHNYARRPLNAHPDFYAIWADGDCRKPSISNLYICDREGNVKMLPGEMRGEAELPIRLGAI
ncbi:TPA: hypothetical protein EYP37_07155 [Candidatus Poribacteria bacterium]|nr:hypothetical protein [Candidatus Poribacteria bacterium]